MRMYTSYNGIRSTGGTGASLDNRFPGCVFAATPSLGALMQLLVGIEVRVLVARTLLRKPGVETGRNQPVGPLLLLGGANRKGVRVLVLDVLVVAAHPAPINSMRRGDLRQLLPQIQ